ncbi:MAG: ABC transporter ATP-binding protein [Clostridia bacterium]|nr:ABC transporter ATP-binding protein [Clostridia bacterium]
MAKKPGGRKRGTMKRVLKYIGRYKYLLPISVLMALINVALSLYVPILIGRAIDVIAVSPIDFTRIAELLTLSAVLIGVGALAQWIMSTINNKISFSVVKDVRNDALARIERLPLSYLDTHPRGDIVSRIINDAEQFSEGLLLGFTQLFTGVLTILATLVFMIYLNWIIALAVFILTPLSLLIARFIASRTHKMFRLRAESEGRQTALIDECLGNQKTVLALSLEGDMTERFDSANELLGKHALDAIFFSSLTNPTTRFINSLVYAAVALTGAISVIATRDMGAAAFTVGELACILSYSNQYTKPFNEISGVVTEFQNALASAARVFELIDERTEEPDPEDAQVLDEVMGEVRLDGVHFSYNEDKPLIEGLNLSVKPGERIAIVGPTGCGKTTLINLLMRFYDVKAGSISLDGTDIRELTRESLRRGYGMVLQDTWLKSGTVRENITFGKPDATDAEVLAAARAAHAHSFIRKLPHGYDTVIGEGGEALSAGQRQLLCIARIMLTSPPMLILDEATSSIDTRTEIKIQRAFAELMRGRTSFIVAHRLSTVREADMIIVMRDGHIIETGRHEELLARGGFYAELYNTQFAHEE